MILLLLQLNSHLLIFHNFSCIQCPLLKDLLFYLRRCAGTPSLTRFSCSTEFHLTRVFQINSKYGILLNIELNFISYLKGMPAIIGSSLTLYINMKLLKKWTFESPIFRTKILL